MQSCRASIRRALAQRTVFTTAVPTRPRQALSFSTTVPARKASPTAPAAAPAQDASEPAAADAAGAEGTAQPIAALSSCPAGTVLTGLNYFKGKADPVALRDEEYPPWLWKCLDVMKKAAAAEDTDAGDEFSKSRKQRRMAAKRQRELEARVLATGDIEALAPKIPLQHQSINLPVTAGGGESRPDDLENTLMAAAKRRELRVALRKERRAKIKESNYLRSM